MSDKLKVGDTVMLKSGSPAMTITTIDPVNPVIILQFWNEGQSHFEQVFLPSTECLELLDFSDECNECSEIKEEVE